MNKNIKDSIKFNPDHETHTLKYDFEYNKNEKLELHKLLNNSLLQILKPF